MNDHVLEVKNVNKSFGKAEILHDISMTLGKGDTYGLIGQNGAGKTTLLRIISGLMQPTGGSIAAHSKRPFIGYMPQCCRFDDGSSVAGTIGLFAAIKKADMGESLALCRRLELDPSKKVRHLSPGQQKKLQIVIAMTGDPDFFVLDEPTAGLDPKATCEMMEIIKSIHREGKSILVSSHILGDMDEICTHVAIMDKGRLVYSNKLEDGYTIRTSPVPCNLLETLQGRYPLQSSENNTIFTVSIGKDDVSGLVKELTAHSIEIFEVSAINLKNVVQQQLMTCEREAG